MKGLPLSSKAEVIIVGGGVTGCAIAYYLAKESVSALIIERDAIGSAASGMAPGVLAPLLSMETPETVDLVAQHTYVDFCMESFNLHRSLHEALRDESGVDVQYRRAHTLLTAFNEDEEKALKEQIPSQRSMGIEAVWLDRDKLELTPGGLGAKVRGALCWYDQAEIESYRLTLAYAQAAESHGAIIRQGTVTAAKHHGARVTGVVVSGREIEADIIVLAMGPWSKAGGSWLKCEIPVKPVRGQIITLEPASALPPYLIYHGINYAVPKAGGSLLIGTTYEQVGFRNRVTQYGQDCIIRRAFSLVPALGHARMVHAVSGFRPLSQDGLPMIGRLPGWDNAYVAAGNGAKGIILSAITGRTVAELISRGHTTTDIQAFDPARFGPAR